MGQRLLTEVEKTARRKGLTLDEHFSVDGTLAAAWASQQSVRCKDGNDDDNPDGVGGNAGRVLMENRNGLIVVALRERRVTPHVAQNTSNRRSADLRRSDGNDRDRSMSEERQLEQPHALPSCGFTVFESITETQAASRNQRFSAAC